MRTGSLNKLSAQAVEAAGDGMHSDGGGLFLRVRGTKRVWLFRFTWEKKKREMGLGTVASVTLASARQKAADARSKIAAGINPLGRAEPTQPTQQAVITFGEASRRYIQVHSPTWSNPKHRQQWRNTLDTYAKDLMALPINQIESSHIASVLTPIWLAKPETARRVRGRVEKIIGSSIALKERTGPNPAAMRDNLEHVLPKQKVTVKHHAAVPVGEAPEAFARIWARRAKGQGYAACITLALSAMRSGEVRRLEWGDISDDTISIPAARMKMKRDHRMPLTGPLKTWICQQPRWLETKLIYPAKSGKPISDMTIAKAMKGVDLRDYTPHGWRSTFRDWAAQNGYPRELAEHQLAHQVGNAVERAYARDTLVEQRRPMMEAWATYVMSTINES